MLENDYVDILNGQTGSCEWKEMNPESHKQQKKEEVCGIYDEI